MSSFTNDLDRLKAILQTELKPSTFEKLTAALLSHQLGIGIAVAKSGFQHGGDAGPAGRQGRRFRIETKRYADSTSLSDRELLGEIDHALERDPALEAWFLVATRSVPEQLENDLMRKSDTLGLPIVIIDWNSTEFPTLAALCTASSEIVEAQAGCEAAKIVRALSGEAQNSLNRLTKDLETWQLGFEQLRTLSTANLNHIWSNPRKSAVALGQNAAGGSKATTIVRPHVEKKLVRWWEGSAKDDAPAAVVGSQGVGKTWATLQWLVKSSEQQPVVLIVPSSAVATLSGATVTSVKAFLGERLCELTEVRDTSHWQQRLERLLKRPVEEGPVISLILDGLNQEPGAPWSALLKALQDPAFAGRIRTVLITRHMHFKDRLGGLRDLIVPPEVITVENYDNSEGGELDQRLELEGLERSSLHEDLLELARVPRLFDLVINLRERFENAESVTLHRLLWEYGRDTFGVRSGANFSEQDWRAWLADVAKTRLKGIPGYNMRTLGETVERPDLDGNTVYLRLSEIVDSSFVSEGFNSRITLTSELVAHALGAALIDHLNTQPTDRDEINKKLTNWLDPIVGLDEKAEVLRAAVSILIETSSITDDLVVNALVFEWLSAQNLPEAHRAELCGIASVICTSLLEVVEQAEGTTLRAARALAVNSISSISRQDQRAMDKIVEKCRFWLNMISREVEPAARQNEEAEARRSKRLVERVGADVDGERQISGQKVTFVERKSHELEANIAPLLEGFPLQRAVPVFEAAAVSSSICMHENYWEALKWLCLLNVVDFEESSAELRSLAEAVSKRSPETGVHPDLPKRVAALLLWLSGDEENEAEAVRINPPLDNHFTYEKDYLADPGKSFFSLEMRHADEVLSNGELPLWRRVERARSFLLDPKYIPPSSFCKEVEDVMASFDVKGIDTSLSRTVKDHNWEQMVPALARCAPGLMAEKLRSKLHLLSARLKEQRYPSAIRAPRHLLLVDEQAKRSAEELRLASGDIDDDHESFLSNQLLIIQMQGLPAEEKMVRILDAGIGAIFQDLEFVLENLSGSEADSLVERYRFGSEEQHTQLVSLLSLTDSELGATSWDWLIEKASDETFPNRGLAFEVLWRSDDQRFGEFLRSQDWHWDPSENKICNHYGSLSLAAASKVLPFEMYAHAIAPWLLLKTLAERDVEAEDVAVAAEILTNLVNCQSIDAPDLGSDISVSDEIRERSPFSFSLSVRPENPDDPAAQLRDAFDTEKATARRNLAVEVAKERIDRARSGGASLFLHSFRSEDFRTVFAHAPGAVENWIEGHVGLCSDFQRKVRLSEGFFVALCEAMLVHSHPRGESLWHALRATLATRILGKAGVEQLIQMAFRATNTPESLRRELVELEKANSDEELFNLVLGCLLSGRRDWLLKIISEDEHSGVTWKVQRSRVLTGLLTRDCSAAPIPWPEGKVASLMESRKRDALTKSRDEEFAHYWWQQYWRVESNEEAYAAWELLLLCVDRRAYVWMEVPPQELSISENAVQKRVAHLQLNFDQLQSAIKKKEDGLDRHFLGRRIVGGIGPWKAV
ncbi:hypothetical protein [Phaeobacter inhibens]|uniref:hypothetical protein n=1 Tax=Phaeobacter inhibens TaxID=221822 RepID=UPI00248FA64B|nr:hypothetical protein [Phaeobacter inhibens]